jgi:hypothetical protein
MRVKVEVGMSGGQAGSRGGCRQSRRCRVRRKREERRAGHERRRRETTAAEEMGQLVEAAIDALARRVLADAERRTDFLKSPAFHEVQDHRLPVRFAQLQQRLIEQRHERRPHGIAFRPGQVQIDRDLFALAPAQFGAQPFAGFVQRRLVEPAGDGRVRAQFARRLRQRHEHVLRDFLGGAGIAHLPQGRGENQIDVLPHQRGKRILAAAGVEFGNQLNVRF